MKAIARRIAALEERPGMNREVNSIIVRNYSKGNPACKSFEDSEMCSSFDSAKQNP